MEFTCKPLPYDADALEPFIGARTVQIHHDRHHAGYVEKLDAALEDARRDQSLTDIMLGSTGHVFNMAAQVWNHDFYWESLAPSKADIPDGVFGEMLDKAFRESGGFDACFKRAATGAFGSGWAWLVFDPDEKRLAIEATSDADNPLTDGKVPLLTLDVWEHAYYLDYQQDRGAYVDEFLDAHVNWAFAADNLETALKRLPL